MNRTWALPWLGSGGKEKSDLYTTSHKGDIASGTVFTLQGPSKEPQNMLGGERSQGRRICSRAWGIDPTPAEVGPLVGRQGCRRLQRSPGSAGLDPAQVPLKMHSQAGRWQVICAHPWQRNVVWRGVGGVEAEGQLGGCQNIVIPNRFVTR